MAAEQPPTRASVVQPASAALAGAGGRVLLVGEPGTGKTTVAEQLVSGVSVGTRVIWLTAVQVEQQLGWAVVADLVSVLADALPVLDEPVRRALSKVFEVDAAGPELDPRSLASAVTSLIRTVVGSGPLLLVIDDLQWVDEPSYVALSYALRRVQADDLRVLATARAHSDRSLPAVVTLVVAPMDAGQIRAVVRERLGRRLTADVAAAVADAVGGNPLHAIETVRALGVRARADDVQLPPSLLELVSDRIQGLSAHCRDALLDLAITLPTASGGDESGAGSTEVEALDQAFTAGVLRRRGDVIEFTHPLLRQAALDTSAPGVRDRAHLRAAARSGDLVRRGHHLAAAHQPPGAVLAAELENAAQAALRRGDAPSAVTLATAAVAASPPQATVPWSRVALQARAYGLTSSVPAELGQRMLELASTPDERVESLLITAEYTDIHGVEQAKLLAAAAAELPGTTAANELRLACLHGFLVGKDSLAASLALLEPAVAAAQARGETSLDLARGLVMTTWFRRLSGLPIDPAALRAAERLQDGALVTDDSAITVSAIISMYDDRHEEARADFHRALERTAGLPTYADFYLAELECRVGEFEPALRRVGWLETFNDDPAHAYLRCHIAAWQGEAAACAASATFGFSLVQPSDSSVFEMGIHMALGLLALGQADPEQAWQHALVAEGMAERNGLREPSHFPALPIAVEAGALTGRFDEATVLLERLRLQGEVLSSRWARSAVLRGEALLTGMAGDPGAGVALARQSLDGFETLGLPTEAGRSALVAGQLARRAGLRTDARGYLNTAIARLTACGAGAFLGTARAELHRLGGRAAGTGELTATERRIADAVAGGASNAEIAVREFVTVKTVEGHLTRIYRKLAVSSRTQLAILWHNRQDGGAA